MEKVRSFLELVNNRISLIELKKHPAELYEPIEYTLHFGGKRIRPVLCLLACDMFGGDIEKALDVAVGIEIFHNFTLLHDDIMDNAPLRRGKHTVHTRWNTNVAILSGDTMMALAYDYIMKAPEEVRSEIFSVFNKTAIEVCEGQQYDMNFETRDDVGLDEYIEMIRLKTAVLLAGSLRIGALLGSASGVDTGKIYRFGEDAGIAFQLKDDLLDAFGDAGKFGKIKGGDILANKKTFLYLKALEIAGEEELKALRMLFGRGGDDDPDKVVKVLEIYEKLNIKEVAGQEMYKYYDKANASLGSVQVPEERKTALKQMAADIIERTY
jgi:geranylgeranyl diphosphate synthase, type II